MNLADENQKNITDHQLKQFKNLVMRLYECCQERMHYQSIKVGLPDAELRCLLLFEDERYLTPKNIAQKMNVVKSRVTKIINGLFEKNLVHRIKDPEDSRVTLLSLTSEGRKKLKEFNDLNDYIHREVLSGMAPEQRITMLTNLELLKASMEACRDLIMES